MQVIEAKTFEQLYSSEVLRTIELHFEPKRDYKFAYVSKIPDVDTAEFFSINVVGRAVLLLKVLYAKDKNLFLLSVIADKRGI